MDLSVPAEALGDRATGPVERGGDAWVHEKGLPTVLRGSLVDQLRGRLLLATDLSDESREANARAMQLAEDTGLPLLILGIDPSGSSSDRRSRRRLSDQLAALVTVAQERAINAEGRLMAGDPALTILRASSSTGIGAIVMGHGQWRGAAATKSISGHVVFHGTKPVLLIGAHVGRHQPAQHRR